MHLVISLVATFLACAGQALDGANLSGGVHPTSSCQDIAKAVSSASSVYWPDGASSQYSEDISHYVASSTFPAACSVEPGNVEDIGRILNIIGRDRVPFAVKGGGHTLNPGFSSTPGIQIAMTRFSDVCYDDASQTVTLGAGRIWDDVYTTLEPHGVNVVGGRVSGIGVAGFTLGGGYSWLSNQHGLAVDNVLAFNLVFPNGTYARITQSSNPDLFWGLKGGFNNFGIVSGFTVKAFPQGEIWGGSVSIAREHFDEVNTAVVKFTSSVRDPKAATIASYTSFGGEAFVSVLLFYDGPTPPDGIFDGFLAIPSIQNVSTRSFASLISSFNFPVNARGVYHTVSLANSSDTILEALVTGSTFWGNVLLSEPNAGIAYSFEPFLPSAFSQGTSDSAAYPPTRDVLIPTNIFISWSNRSSDDLAFNIARQSAEQLTSVAEAQGQSLEGLGLYGNYAIFGTPLEKIYGGNLGRLRRTKRRYDPNNVMNLAGGWKF